MNYECNAVQQEWFRIKANLDHDVFREFVRHLEKQIFMRKCSETGIGLNQGVYCDGELFSSFAAADKYCLAFCGASYETLAENEDSEYYYSEWELDFDEEELYDCDGNLLTPNQLMAFLKHLEKS